MEPSPDDQAVAISLDTASSNPSSSSSLVLGEGRRGHRGGRVLIDVFLVDGEDFRAGVAFFQVEIAGGLELNGLVVGIVVGERDVDLEVGVVEDVFLALLHGRRGRGRQRRLGLAGLCLGGRLGRWRWLVRLELVVGERGQLDRIVMAQIEIARRLEVDPGVAGAGEVDAREVGVGGRDVRVAGSTAGWTRTRRWRPGR